MANNNQSNNNRPNQNAGANRPPQPNQNSQPKPTRPPGPRLKWKESMEFRHDLIKLGVAKMKKNVSYKMFQPSIEEVEHVHFFHSHDMKGKKQTTCSPIGGHFHFVSVDFNRADANGDPLITVGPPKCYRQKKLRGGRMKTVISDVFYETADDDDEVTGRIVDEHTHDAEYVRSELISPKRIKDQQQHDKAAVRSMMSDSIASALANNQPKPSDETPAPGAGATDDVSSFNPPGDLDKGEQNVGGTTIKEA